MDLDPDTLREKLLERKLGPLLHWTAPEIKETVGPWKPEVFKAYEQDLEELVVGLKERLQTYSHEELAALLDGQDQNHAVAITFWRSFLTETVDRLRRQQPPWYAGGFGHPDHQADLDYWSKMDRFTIHEFLCLSVGVEPASLPPKMLKDAREHRDRDRLRSTVRFLLKQDELLRRRFGTSPTLQVGAFDFLVWAEKVHPEVHPRFLENLRKYHAWHAGPKEEPQTTPSAKTDKREIDSIAKLFVVMAVDHLGYDPNQKRSPIPKEIADIAAANGIDISDDTVRRYLKLGASFLDQDGEAD